MHITTQGLIQGEGMTCVCAHAAYLPAEVQSPLHAMVHASAVPYCVSALAQLKHAPSHEVVTAPLQAGRQQVHTNVINSLLLCRILLGCTPCTPTVEMNSVQCVHRLSPEPC